MIKNKLSYLPVFSTSYSLKELVINAEENSIEKINDFGQSFDQFKKLEKLELKLNKNKLAELPAFSYSGELKEFLLEAQENEI